MVEGRVRRHRGDLPGALESFRRADTIVAAPTTAFEIGTTLLAMKRLVEARHVLQRVVAAPANSKEPPPFAVARREALGLLEDLKRRIPKVEVEVVGARGEPEVRIDGRLVESADGTRAWEVDPGRHVVHVVVAGESLTHEVSVDEGETERVVLRIPERGDRPEDARRSVVAPSSEEASPVRTAAWWAAGVGAAAGIVAGSVAYGRVRDVRSQCDGNVCPPSAQGEIDAARDWANVATLGFGVALAGGAVLGVDMLLREEAPGEEAWVPVLRVGPSCASAAWSFP